MILGVWAGGSVMEMCLRCGKCCSDWWFVVTRPASFRGSSIQPWSISNIKICKLLLDHVWCEILLPVHLKSFPCAWSLLLSQNTKFIHLPHHTLSLTAFIGSIVPRFVVTLSTCSSWLFIMYMPDRHPMVQLTSHGQMTAIYYKKFTFSGKHLTTTTMPSIYTDHVVNAMDTHAQHNIWDTCYDPMSLGKAKIVGGHWLTTCLSDILIITKNFYISTPLMLLLFWRIKEALDTAKLPCLGIKEEMYKAQLVQGLLFLHLLHPQKSHLPFFVF